MNGSLDVEVVVEAVADRRADAELGLGVELLHGLGQHVRGRVPQDRAGRRGSRCVTGSTASPSASTWARSRSSPFDAGDDDRPGRRRRGRRPSCPSATDRSLPATVTVIEGRHRCSLGGTTAAPPGRAAWVDHRGGDPDRCYRPAVGDRAAVRAGTPGRRPRRRRASHRREHPGQPDGMVVDRQPRRPGQRHRADAGLELVRRQGHRGWPGPSPRRAGALTRCTRASCASPPGPRPPRRRCPALCRAGR